VLDADTLKPIADEVNAKGDVMLIASRAAARATSAKTTGRNGEMKGLRSVCGRADLEQDVARRRHVATVIAYDEIYNAIQTV